MSESRFTSLQVHKWTGLSLDMIDYLCRMEIVKPVSCGRRGRGRMREFVFADVVLLRTIKHLLNQGISVKKLKVSLMNLREKFTEFTPGNMPKKFLYSDGKELYIKTQEDILIEISKSNQMAFGFILDLKNLQEDLTKQRPASVA